MLSKSLAIAVVCGLAPLVVISAAAPPAEALPAGFTDQAIFTNLEQPISVDFSEDGRVFVAEKSGLVKVFDGLGDATPAVFADLRTNVFNEHDRGMMAVALAPTFPTDPSVYVLYSHDAAIGGTAPLWGTPGATGDHCPNPPGETADGCVISGRLSKLDASKPGGGTEQVLVEDWCQQFPSHTVGDLKFGPDGYLYASSGEGASYMFADYGQTGNPKNPCGDPPTGTGGNQTVPSAEGGALRAQDIQTLGDPMSLSGGVIRIDPNTGQGAPGNPMITSTDPNARRLIAAGLRNPFRFTFRPGTGEIWLGNVGWVNWEEIDRLVSPIDGNVDNFGWPCMEGNALNSGYNLGLTMCERIYSGAVPTIAPFYTYHQNERVEPNDGCSSTTGSSLSGTAFYTGNSYPAQYKGSLFFADYARRCMWVMLPGANGVPDPATRKGFLTGVFPADLKSGPNGDMFYVDLPKGEIHRIKYTAGGDQPPVASITATPTQGALPLAVSFDASASADPEGQALTYAWDLDGDGAFNDGAGPTITKTYTTAKVYKAGVRVSDPHGASDVASKQIFAGTTPPTPTIIAPDTTFTWKVGDKFSFNGSATDAEDGNLPASALKWQVILHHCDTINACHEHQLTSFEGVTNGTFDAPDHEYPAHLELRLTATDSTGAKSTTSRQLDPKVSTLTFETNPPGLITTLTTKTGVTPYSTQAIVGSRLTLSAAQTQAIGPNIYEFQNWSDGGARVHDIIVGATDKTYQANYQFRSGNVSVSLLKWGDGLQVYARGMPSAHVFQKPYTPATGWHDWVDLAGTVIGTPVQQQFGDKLYMFAVSSPSRHLLQKTYSPTTGWADWVDLGGVVDGNPAVAVQGNDMHVFARDAASLQLVRKTFNATTGWTAAWTPLGGVIQASPAVVRHGNDLSVFAVGSSSGHLLQRTHNPTTGWADWVDLGGIVDGTPAVAVNGNDLHVFARGVQSLHMFGRSYKAGTGWADWIDLGGVVEATPGVTMYEGGVHLFAVGNPNKHLFQKVLNPATGGWSDWIDHGGTLAGTPAATQYGDQLHVFAVGTPSHHLFQRAFVPTSGWRDWIDLGGTLG